MASGRHPAYGPAHRARRKLLLEQLAEWPGLPCSICQQPMDPMTQALELHHSQEGSKEAGEPGDQLVHRRCNRRLGGEEGNRRMRAKYPTYSGSPASLAAAQAETPPAPGTVEPCNGHASWYIGWEPPPGTCTTCATPEQELRCNRAHVSRCKVCGTVMSYGRAQ